MKKALTHIILFLLTSTTAFAQNFPVQSIVNITPPFSVYLSDYASISSDKLLVTLMLKDISQPDIQVKLRLTIKGNGIELRTKADYQPLPLLLQGGAPLLISGTELEGYLNPANLDFSGISKSEFIKTGKLPEGVYQFMAEAVEYRRNVVVSNNDIRLAWLVLNDPPRWTLPMANSLLTATYPQNIFFSWMPMSTASPNSAFTTEYEFTMVELWPDNRAPGDAINSSIPVYQTTTINTSLVYGPAEPELVPGRKYVCRLRAYDTEKRDLFKNKGYSEILVFTFGQACKPPNTFQHQVLGPEDARVNWTSLPGNTQFTLSYAEQNADGTWSNWYHNEAMVPFSAIKGLKPQHTYRYQLKAICGTLESEYSETKQFSTPAPDTAGVECGKDISIPKLDDSPPLPVLKVGDIINVGGFEARIIEVEGSGGSFSGKCAVNVKTFGGVRILSEFENISINESHQVTAGVINSVKGELNIIGLDGILDSLGITGNDDVVDNEGNGDPNVGDPYEAGDSVLVVLGGEEIIITGDTTIITAAGDTIVTDFSQIPPIITVNGDPTDITTDKLDFDNPGGGTDGGDLAGNVTDTSAHAIKLVIFKPAKDQFFGLDQYPEDIPQFLSDYDKERVNKKDYYMHWKSSQSSGMSDKVVMEITTGVPDSIRSRLSVESSVSGPLNYSFNASDSIWELIVSGQSHENEDHIIAYYTQDDGSKIAVGHLNLVSYNKQDMKLVIVPVGDKYGFEKNPNYTELKDSLNAIYKGAITFWDVSIADPLEVDYEDNDIKGLDTDLPEVAAYTKEMRNIRSAFKKRSDYNKDAYYLFLVDKSEKGDKNGIMPFRRHFGFIFMDEIQQPESEKLKNNKDKLFHTIAHELGHGPFGLEHVWQEKGTSQGSTYNLMDYTSKKPNNLLRKYQWHYIHNPKSSWFGGSEEETSEAVVTEIKKLKDAFENKDGSLTFLTPAGKVISLKGNIEYVVFSTPGDDWILTATGEKISVFPIGTLKRFKIGNNVYKPKGNYGQDEEMYFNGYYCKEINENYKDVFSYKLDKLNTIIGFVCFGNGTFKVSAHSTDIYKCESSEPVEYIGKGKQIPITKLLDEYWDWNTVSYNDNYNGLVKVEIGAYVDVKLEHAFANYFNALGIDESCGANLIYDLQSIYFLNKDVNIVSCIPSLNDAITEDINFLEAQYEKEFSYLEKLNTVETKYGPIVFNKPIESIYEQNREKYLLDLLIQANKAITNFNYNDGVIDNVISFLADLDEAIRPCVIQKVPLQAKKNILINHKTMSSVWQTKERTLTELLIYSEPQDQEELIKMLKGDDNKYELFWSVYNDINGQNSESFVGAITSIICNRADYEDKALDLELLEEEPKESATSYKVVSLHKKSLTPNFSLQVNDFYKYDGTGTVVIEKLDVLGNSYIFNSNPFDLVKIIIADDFQFEIKGKKINKGDVIYAPAIAAYSILKRQQTTTAWNALWVTVEAVAIVSTAGMAAPEIFAIEAGIGSVDIVLTLSEDAIKSSNDAPAIEFHQNLQTFTGLASMGIALPSMAKMGLKLVKNAKAKLSDLDFDALKSTTIGEIEKLKNNLSGIAKSGKTTIKNIGDNTVSFIERSYDILKSAGTYRKLFSKIIPKVGSTEISAAGNKLFVNGQMVAEIEETTDGIIILQKLNKTDDIADKEVLFEFEDVSFKTPAYKIEKGNVSIVKDKSGNILTFVEVISETYPKWVDDLLTDLPDQLKLLFKQKLADKKYLELFENASEAYRKELLNIWKHTSNSTFAPSADELVKADRYKKELKTSDADFKYEIEGYSSKKEFIQDVAKVFNKTKSNINFDELINATVDGIKIPVKLSDYCFDKAVIYVNKLEEQGFKVKKAMAISVASDNTPNLHFKDDYITDEDIKALETLNDFHLKSMPSAWRHHIVPVIQYIEDNKVVEKVIDPFASKTKALSITEWMESMKNRSFETYKNRDNIAKYFNSDNLTIYNPENPAAVFILEKNCYAKSTFITSPTKAPEVSSAFTSLMRHYKIFELADKLRQSAKNKVSIDEIEKIILSYKNASGSSTGFTSELNDRFMTLMKYWFSPLNDYLPDDFDKLRNVLDIPTQGSLNSAFRAIGFKGEALENMVKLYAKSSFKEKYKALSIELRKKLLQDLKNNAELINEFDGNISVMDAWHVLSNSDLCTQKYALQITSEYITKYNTDIALLMAKFNNKADKTKFIHYLSFENKISGITLYQKEKVIFISKNDPIFRYAQIKGTLKNNDVGWNDIVIHGKEDGTGFTIYNSSMDTWVDITPEELASKLEEMEVGDIRLLSCHAGAGAGEKLAKVYSNGKVKYPNTKKAIQVSLDGNMTVSESGYGSSPIIWKVYGE